MIKYFFETIFRQINFTLILLKNIKTTILRKCVLSMLVRGPEGRKQTVGWHPLNLSYKLLQQN